MTVPLAATLNWWMREEAQLRFQTELQKAIRDLSI